MKKADGVIANYVRGQGEGHSMVPTSEERFGQ